MVCGPRGSELCPTEAPVKGHNTKVGLRGRGHLKNEEGIVQLTAKERGGRARFVWIQTHGWMFPENRHSLLGGHRSNTKKGLKSTNPGLN